MAIKNSVYSSEISNTEKMLLKNLKNTLPEDSAEELYYQIVKQMVRRNPNVDSGSINTASKVVLDAVQSSLSSKEKTELLNKMHERNMDNQLVSNSKDEPLIIRNNVDGSSKLVSFMFGDLEVASIDNTGSFNGTLLGFSVEELSDILNNIKLESNLVDFVKKQDLMSPDGKILRSLLPDELSSIDSIKELINNEINEHEAIKCLEWKQL